MATRKIKDAKDLGLNELIYFKGHAKATYMSSGQTVEDAIINKQDLISDLENIRKNASLGATALQSYNEKYTGTITEIQMNGSSKGTAGVIDLGTVITSLDGYVKDKDLAPVAKTGAYSDLIDKPTIPEAVTESTVTGWGFAKTSDLNDSINTVEFEDDLDANAELGSLAKVVNTNQLSVKDCYYNVENPIRLSIINVPYIINKDISNLYNLQLMFAPSGFSSASDFNEVSDDVRNQMVAIIIAEDNEIPTIACVFMGNQEVLYLCSGLIDEATHDQNVQKLNNFISNKNLVLYTIDFSQENAELITLTEEQIESLDYLLQPKHKIGLYFKDYSGWNNISEKHQYDLSDINQQIGDINTILESIINS